MLLLPETGTLEADVLGYVLRSRRNHIGKMTHAELLSIIKEGYEYAECHRAYHAAECADVRKWDADRKAAVAAYEAKNRDREVDAAAALPANSTAFEFIRARGD